jgi:hypothetical protein
VIRTRDASVCSLDAGPGARRACAALLDIMTTIKDFLPKWHIRDYIPDWFRNWYVFVLFLLGLLAFVGSFWNALKTGMVQRLPDTPKYSRLGDPAMFWILVVFYATASLAMAAGLAVSIMRLVNG